MTKAKGQANTLTVQQVNKVFNRIKLMSNPCQKAAIIALSLTGLRVTELSLITVSDLVTKQGEIKPEIALRAAITKGCKPRTIWLSKRAQDVIQEYIDHRLSLKQGVSLNNSYQGLNPRSCFILSSKGFPYSLKAKKRVSYDGTLAIYWCADSVELLVRNIYQKCGMKGTSHSGRRSLASNLNAANVPLKTIARTLGHREIQTSLLYIEITPKQLEKAAELAL